MSALVLAGGASTRLGEDKPAALVGGVPLLDRVLGALSNEADVVVVGPARRTARPVRFVLEQPPGGGPVAAIAAGLAQLAAERCFLLAADLPFLTAAALVQLTTAFWRDAGETAPVGPGDVDPVDRVDRISGVDRVSAVDGVVAVDEAGREQPLLSYWATEALRRALPPVPGGARLHEMLSRLSYATVRLTGERPPHYDCDTAEALERARAWVLRWNSG